RSTATTVCPARIRARVIAAPMPPAAPVTRTTRELSIDLPVLDTRGLDHRTPAIDLGLEKRRELAWTGADHGRAELCIARLHRWMIECRDRILMQSRDDLGRRLRGDEQREPGRHVVSRHELGDRRQVRHF